MITPETKNIDILPVWDKETEKIVGSRNWKNTKSPNVMIRNGDYVIGLSMYNYGIKKELKKYYDSKSNHTHVCSLHLVTLVWQNF